MWNLTGAIDELLQKARVRRPTRPDWVHTLICMRLEEALLWSKHHDEFQHIDESNATDDEV